MYYLVRDYYDETKKKIFSDKDDIEEYIDEYDNSKELLLVYNWEKGMYNDTRNGKRIYFDQYFMLKKSENVFDLIEVGDLVKVEDGTFIVSMKNDRVFVIKINEGQKVRRLTSIKAIYKPNKNGDYIKVWERVNENENS